MRRSNSWVAFRLDSKQALEKLQLEPTGEVSELPKEAVSGVALESGWYVVVANDFRFVERARLENLSFDCDVVSASLDDATNLSQAMMWRHGVLEWAVIHDGSVSRTHMQMEGAPPREVHALLAEARANKKPFVDHVFEVPIRLVDAVMGFAFGQGLSFEALKPAEAKWREFRHADGRRWAIRPDARGYQLRIGEGDDAVVKQRATDKPAKDIEALVAEQLADGFTAAN